MRRRSPLSLNLRLYKVEGRVCMAFCFVLFDLRDGVIDFSNRVGIGNERVLVQSNLC